MNPMDPADTELMLEQVRRFAQTEVAPHLEAWEAAGEFPRGMYKRWADLGWMAMGYPEELGGIAAPWTLRNAFGVAVARYTGSAPSYRAWANDMAAQGYAGITLE